MRIPHPATLIPAVAAAAAVLVGGAGAAHAAPTKCIGGGICVTISAPGSGSTKVITVDGTSGNDTINVKLKPASGNNSLPHIQVNEFDTAVDTTASANLVVKGIGGNDTISLAGLDVVGNFRSFGTATLDGGAGNDAITASNGGVSELIGGSGVDQLFAVNGKVDTVHKDNDTIQVDSIDNVVP